MQQVPCTHLSACCTMHHRDRQVPNRRQQQVHNTSLTKRALLQRDRTPHHRALQQGRLPRAVRASAQHRNHNAQSSPALAPPCDAAGRARWAASRTHLGACPRRRPAARRRCRSPAPITRGNDGIVHTQDEGHATPRASPRHEQQWMGVSREDAANECNTRGAHAPANDTLQQTLDGDIYSHPQHTRPKEMTAGSRRVREQTRRQQKRGRACAGDRRTRGRQASASDHTCVTPAPPIARAREQTQ